MEALRSSETSVITRSIRRNIPEEGVLQESCIVQHYCPEGLLAVHDWLSAIVMPLQAAHDLRQQMDVS
jgi:hypothetical protein